MTQPISDVQLFEQSLLALMPRLRAQALALTRNKAAAEDLVQDAVVNALANRESFMMGTNFPAWMHRILRNRFFSDRRKRREETGADDNVFANLADAAPHEERVMLRELAAGLDRLPTEQREALVLSVLHGMSYEDLAAATGCAVGTVKCHVSRARARLRLWLMDGDTNTRTTRAPARRGATATPRRGSAKKESGSVGAAAPVL